MSKPHPSSSQTRGLEKTLALSTLAAPAASQNELAELVNRHGI